MALSIDLPVRFCCLRGDPRGQTALRDGNLLRSDRDRLALVCGYDAGALFHADVVTQVS